MDEKRVNLILERLRKRGIIKELLVALNENNHSHWSEEGFEAIKRVLRERKIDFKVFPEQNDISKTDEFNVKFSRWKALTSANCPYVGKGKIVLSPYGINIFGKILDTIKPNDPNYVFDPRRSILGLLLFRKKENIVIPWEDIINVKQDQKNKKIRIDYICYDLFSVKAPENASAIFKSDCFDLIVSAFEKRGRKPIV